MRKWTISMLVLGSVACTTVRQLRDPDALPANGRAEKTRDKAALDYSIATVIHAPPQTVWKILTDAPNYLSWNSTLVRLDGQIAPQSTIQLVAKIAPERTFSLKVSEFDPPHKMVWEDGGPAFLGVRHFTLTPAPEGTVFAMSETYSGAFLGAAESQLPDLTQPFEAFASDLKKRAEEAGGRAQASP